ncbi:chitosanase (glycosyl hydrolase group 75) [Methylobacter tundripaludum]|uniref:Chitosanase (Glycosyl hydrolase group 75) n=1 Tax=Methylobacter tundripaludum TaxID=173365 RepID=A0A2S6H2J9_9GAMM|nr:glycoside hydrolase family 75 protein [Methylobacter tundripaludum]PPK71661.1 chitosanase (glycosyl hydrolase group 75) [Methylobacter tundripaludum]
MRIQAFVVMLFLCGYSLAEEKYTPPQSSALGGVSFDGTAVGQQFHSRFTECDMKNMCDGKKLKYGCSSDQNHNTTILKLKNDTIFYDAKMGLDADGSPYSKNTPGQTDQPETSLRYPLSGKPSINADRVPFIVIPLGGFDNELGVTIGDVAAVVYGQKRVFAVVADQGPKCKLGEGSIQLHELLGHTVCKARDSKGDCVKLRNVGIDKNVQYFIFPGTHKELMLGLTPQNIIEHINSIGETSWQKLTASAE